MSEERRKVRVIKRGSAWVLIDASTFQEVPGMAMQEGKRVEQSAFNSFGEARRAAVIAGYTVRR